MFYVTSPPPRLGRPRPPVVADNADETRFFGGAADTSDDGSGTAGERLSATNPFQLGVNRSRTVIIYVVFTAALTMNGNSFLTRAWRLQQP